MSKYKFIAAIFLATFITSSFASTKIFSMNIHCFKDSWKERIPQILDEAIQLNSDLINLQELCIDKNENMHKFILNYLYAKTGKNWYSQKHYMHLAWDKYDEYLALYSKKKPQDVQADYLPASPLQRAYVAMKINNIWFVGLHLEYSHEWANYRYEQIHSLINKFDQEKSVLMGDFNSGYNWPEQRELKSHGWTPYFPGHTYPSHKPYKGIDGFWLSPLIKNKVTKIKKVLETPVLINNTSMHLSDHFGTFLEIQKK